MLVPPDTKTAHHVANFVRHSSSKEGDKFTCGKERIAYCVDGVSGGDGLLQAVPPPCTAVEVGAEFERHSRCGDLQPTQRKK